MSFRIAGLDPAPFRPLFGLPDAALARRRARRVVADAPFGFPDRVSLRDAAPGTPLLLVHHVHQPADTPFHASHAIFVAEGEAAPAEHVGAVPEMLACRTLSLRAFTAGGDMADAALVPGDELAPTIARLLADPAVAYLHAHFATRGCFAARIDRA
jgi:hypothetical protein